MRGQIVCWRGVQLHQLLMLNLLRITFIDEIRMTGRFGLVGLVARPGYGLLRF